MGNGCPMTSIFLTEVFFFLCYTRFVMREKEDVQVGGSEMISPSHTRRVKPGEFVYMIHCARIDDQTWILCR